MANRDIASLTTGELVRRDTSTSLYHYSIVVVRVLEHTRIRCLDALGVDIPTFCSKIPVRLLRDMLRLFRCPFCCIAMYINSYRMYF